MSLLFAVRSREQNTIAVGFLLIRKFYHKRFHCTKPEQPSRNRIGRGDLNSVELSTNFFGALIQYPGKTGAIPNLKSDWKM